MVSTNSRRYSPPRHPPLTITRHSQLQPDDLSNSGVTEDKSSAATPIVHDSVPTDGSNAPTTNEVDGQGHDAESTDTAPLADRTQPAELGGVDAFLTHSWADEVLAPGEKYRAIAAWAERFRAENDGREPTIWLDKACIVRTCARARAYVADQPDVCPQLITHLNPCSHRRTKTILTRP